MSVGNAVKKARFYSSVGAIYALTLLFVASIFHLGMFHKTPILYNTGPIVPHYKAVVVTAGKPVRIVVPSLSIDLPVDDGVYDAANKTWSLSGYHAQFALPSIEANNIGGNTLIYGHNNRYVFGPLKAIQPGAAMQLYTDNGFIFNYAYTSSDDLQPDNTSIFTYQGPPQVTVQTCVGSFNEVRRMYHFSYVGVTH